MVPGPLRRPTPYLLALTTPLVFKFMHDFVKPSPKLPLSFSVVSAWKAKVPDDKPSSKSDATKFQFYQHPHTLSSDDYTKLQILRDNPATGAGEDSFFVVSTMADSGIAIGVADGVGNSRHDSCIIALNDDRRMEVKRSRSCRILQSTLQREFRFHADLQRHWQIMLLLMRPN